MKADSSHATDEARRQIDERLAGALTSGRALLALVSAARRVQDRYNDALAEHDISLSQYQILDYLRRAGAVGIDAEDFHSGMRDLCVSATCEAHVERMGWLKREHSGTRHITEPGRQLLAELAPMLDELANAVAGGLGINQLGELVGLTARLDPEGS